MNKESTLRPSHTINPDDINSPITKPIWSIDDLARITGFRKQTIYNRIREIPHRKKGRRLFFFPDEILNWIDEGDLD